MKRVSIETDDIRSAISALAALACANVSCAGFEEEYTEGVTCLRCQTIIQMNSWLPEGEQVDGIGKFPDPDFDPDAEPWQEDPNYPGKPEEQQ